MRLIREQKKQGKNLKKDSRKGKRKREQRKRKEVQKI